MEEQKKPQYPQNTGKGVLFAPNITIHGAQVAFVFAVLSEVRASFSSFPHVYVCYVNLSIQPLYAHYCLMPAKSKFLTTLGHNFTVSDHYSIFYFGGYQIIYIIYHIHQSLYIQVPRLY